MTENFQHIELPLLFSLELNLLIIQKQNICYALIKPNFMVRFILYCNNLNYLKGLRNVLKKLLLSNVNIRPIARNQIDG